MTVVARRGGFPPGTGWPERLAVVTGWEGPRPSGAGDPDDWPVLVQQDFDDWQRFDRGTGEFILRMLTDRKRPFSFPPAAALSAGARPVLSDIDRIPGTSGGGTRAAVARRRRGRRG